MKTTPKSTVELVGGALVGIFVSYMIVPIIYLIFENYFPNFSIGFSQLIFIPAVIGGFMLLVRSHRKYFAIGLIASPVILWLLSFIWLSLFVQRLV